MIGFPKPTKKRKLTPLEKAIAKAAEKQGIDLKPQHKYGAIPRDGFPSTLERDTYGTLLLRQQGGEIKNLRRYATVHLGYGIFWKIDFYFELTEGDEPSWAEAKGKWSADAMLKLRMWKNGAGPGRLEIWKSGRRGPELTEVIQPKEMK